MQRVTLLLALTVTLSQACQVCVIEPLITSPIQCPVCTVDGTSEVQTSSNGHLNWTTCFVHANPCNASYKYRTIDGSCNNLKNPTMGMFGTVFIRILPAHYHDNKHSFRLASDGQSLPLARALTTTFFSDKDRPDDVSLNVMQWGQIVSHDIVQSKPTVDRLFTNIDCCSPYNLHRDICLPQPVPFDDHFYAQFNVTCLNQARNNVTLIGDCNSNQPGQQYSNVTHPLDASLVYGPTLERAHRIREFKGGRLRTRRTHDGRILLPNLPERMIPEYCFVQSPDESCYDTGDSRAVQNPHLTILQIMLVRQHNTIADKLQELHPEWDDEAVYQESRAIIMAIVQHITYKEWLEFYIGKHNMRKYKLYPLTSGYTEYKDDINMATINSFVTAAFRFPHSGIQGHINLVNPHGITEGSVPISDWMNRPSIIEESQNFDQFLLGSIHQPMQAFDDYFTDQMNNLLFHVTGPFGTDLMSLDIERGRDHGMAPYVHYLEICTGHRAATFRHLTKFIPKKHVQKLQKLYKAVEDIDLMVGGSLEFKVPGTKLGPTFVCLHVEEFYRKKWGDRFWYEVKGQPHSFTSSQLDEIRKITLSRLVCDNSDNITHVPANSFLLPSERNPTVPCSAIPKIDLNQWK